MQLDLDKYRRALRPANIFEILPRPIIEQMIRGFFYHMKKGVTLLWSEWDTTQGRSIIQDDRLDPFDYTNPKDREFYNRVCWEYRSTCGDLECHKCDKRVAQEYVDAKPTEVAPYPCWLGMDDLAYPLTIGDQVCGCSLAGRSFQTTLCERLGSRQQYASGWVRRIQHWLIA